MPTSSGQGETQITKTESQGKKKRMDSTESEVELAFQKLEDKKLELVLDMEWVQKEDLNKVQGMMLRIGGVIGKAAIGTTPVSNCGWPVLPFFCGLVCNKTKATTDQEPSSISPCLPKKLSNISLVTSGDKLPIYSFLNERSGALLVPLRPSQARLQTAILP
ncbi:uncharacterized protein G2W53_024420 [Senna tora]|uniref:Uncharacterized protein n=1 Tax=Senna tora TaxID=362788 RepID=A0A834TDD3_9FABA|nr:uncharacterized protein G2W53_024420 [Senna tora]